MDKMEEITEKGDQYVKRKLLRKREHNQSPEHYSKSLRRRQNVLEAINNNMTSSSSQPYDGNPFEREFANTSGICEELDRRGKSASHAYSSSCLDVDDDESALPPFLQTYRVVQEPKVTALPEEEEEEEDKEDDEDTTFEDEEPISIDDNFNSIQYYHSNQHVREKLMEVLRGNEAEKERMSYGGPLWDDGKRESKELGRLSLGERLANSTHRGLRTQHYLDKAFDDEFERGNAELQRQGPDRFFGTRVLEILEPEVVQVERKSVEPSSSRRRVSDMTFIQENFPDMQLQESPAADESFVSEDIREINREIEELQFQPNVLEQQQQQRPQSQRIGETPKGIYANLALVRRMSDNFTPKKLFHAEAAAAEEESDTDFNCNTTKTFDDSEKPVTPEEDTMYTTSIPIPSSQLNNLDYSNRQPQNHPESTTMSFLKQNTSFLFNNLQLPKNTHRKPNLESTRKIFSSGGQTLSPVSHVGSTISTLTMPYTPSSPDTYEAMTTIQQHEQQEPQQHQQQLNRVQRHVQSNMDGTLPFEVENFLELALGDDQYNNSTITYAYSEMRDRSNSHINASELMSEDRTPTKNRTQKVMRIPMSEPSSKPKSTLNRTLTMYKTLTHRIKRRFRGNAKELPQSLHQDDSAFPNLQPKDLKDNVKKLLADVDMQQILIYQASKALDLCNSMREFIASPERVESERLLILAKLRKKAAQEEIGRLTGQTSDHVLYRERGELTLKDLSLQLREDVLRRERQGGDVVEWYVVVVSEGSTVWATQACECPMTSPRLYFPGQLLMPGLSPNFRLTLTVYSLKLQKVIFNHEDKYRIQKSHAAHRHSTCPSPKTLLRRSDKKKSIVSPKQQELRFSGIQETSFVVNGSLDLMLHDLNLKSPWPLFGVPIKSSLLGTIDLSLTCRLELSVSHAGFLTHGDEAGGMAVWNRRWCVLEGPNLLFWNYPREQECKPPLYAIDLVYCASRRISLIDRSLCAKPRTLLIETARSRSAIDHDSILLECRNTCTVVRNLLSCDTNQDLTEWQSKLNHVVSALREWRIINTKMIL